MKKTPKHDQIFNQTILDDQFHCFRCPDEACASAMDGDVFDGLRARSGDTTVKGSGWRLFVQSSEECYLVVLPK